MPNSITIDVARSFDADAVYYLDDTAFEIAKYLAESLNAEFASEGTVAVVSIRDFEETRQPNTDLPALFVNRTEDNIYPGTEYCLTTFEIKYVVSTPDLAQIKGIGVRIAKYINSALQKDKMYLQLGHLLSDKNPVTVSYETKSDNASAYFTAVKVTAMIYTAFF